MVIYMWIHIHVPSLVFRLCQRVKRIKKNLHTWSPAFGLSEFVVKVIAQPLFLNIVSPNIMLKLLYFAKGNVKDKRTIRPYSMEVPKTQRENNQTCILFN